MNVAQVTKVTTSKHHRVNKFYVTVLHFILFELFTEKLYRKYICEFLENFKKHLETI